MVRARLTGMSVVQKLNHMIMFALRSLKNLYDISRKLFS